YPGGDGGGVVMIDVTGAVVIDGAVRANGQDMNINSSYRGGGGAGGSVLIEADTIGGTGVVTAAGGEGHTSYATGGGGGRVALLAATAIDGPLGGSAPFASFDVGGADGYGSPEAGAGTFFRRVGTADGDLIIDNEGITAYAGSTPLPFQGQGTSSQLSSTVLTDATATFGPGLDVVTYLVNPKANQGGGNLGDDAVFAITANTGTALTVGGGGLTGAAAVGDTWSAYYRFDNFEVRGRANVAADAQIRVDAGDVSGGDAETFALGGVLTVRELDLATVEQLSLTSGYGATLTVDTLRHGDSTTFAWDVDLNDGLLQTTTFTLGTLTATSGSGRLRPKTQAGSTLTLTQPVDVTGATVGPWGTIQAAAGGGLSVAGGTWTTTTFAADGDLRLTEVSKKDDGTGTFQTTGVQTVVVATDITAGGTVRVDGGADVEAATVTGGVAVRVEADPFAVATTVLRQPAMTTDDVVKKIHVAAPAIVVASGAQVTGDGRGYLGGYSGGNGGYGRGPTGLAAPQYYTGGSHGGRANQYNTSYTVTPAYDSLYQPRLPGAGGGSYGGSSTWYGGNGGGVVELAATGTVTIDGAVTANGNSGNNYGAGGAGGSVLVTAATIAGGGQIEAKGGNSPGDQSTGGGGGRVALRATTAIDGPLGSAAPWASFNVAGGTGYGADAGAGTFFRKVGSAYGDLIIDNEGIESFAGATPLVFQGTGVVTSHATSTLTDATANFLAFGPLTDYLVSPDDTQGTASLGDDVVFPIASATEFNLNVTGNLGSVTADGDRWTAYYRFDNFEVRGRARVVADAQVRVESGDVSSDDGATFRVGGTLDVRQLDLHGVDLIALTASQGSRLYVDTIQRDHDYAYPFDFSLSDGYVYVDTLAIGTVTATTGRFQGGGNASSTLVVHEPIGAGGTFTGYREVRAPLNEPLTITGGTWDVTTIVSDGALTITGGTITAEQLTSTSADITVSGGAHVDAQEVTAPGTVTVSGAGTVLSHPDVRDTATTDLPTLVISCANAVVGAGASVDVTGRGYRGGGQSYNGGVEGYAPTGLQRSGYHCGGAHGGISQNYQQSASYLSGVAYDSITRPRLPGGGGGRSASNGNWYGGSGGGVIEILASGAVTIDGSLVANGQAGSNSPGGAGGTVYVQAASIGGAGVVEAKGGVGHDSYGSGGGGGRIALVAGSAITGTLGGDAPWDAVNVSGGLGYGSDSGAGTFFRKVGSGGYGDLLIDNEGVTTFAGSTPLPFQGSGTIDAVSALSFRDVGVDFTKNGPLATFQVNPVASQGGRGLDDDQVFTLASAASDTVTIASGNLSAVAVVGDTWSAYYRFDNLEVRGRAQVAADAQVRVDSGDIGHGDAATFELGGRLDVRELDLNGVSSIALTTGTSARFQPTTLRHDDLESFPYDVDLGNGTFLTNRVTLASFVSAGGSLLPVTKAGSVVVVTEPLTTTAVTVGPYELVTTPVGDGMSLSAGTWKADTFTSYADVVLADAVVVETTDVQADGDVVISGGAQVRTEGLRAAHDVIVEDAGTKVTLVGMTTNDVITSLQIEAVDVTVAAGATLMADAAGYLGGYSGGAGASGRAPTNVKGAGYQCGGAHGGMSPDYSPGSGPAYARGVVFDSLWRPRYPGGGGGPSASNPTSWIGGNGGGLVEIIATGTVTLDGTVTANGGAPGYGGGGAGGGIYVQAA
ncbi:MAG: hypothetical protein KC635_03815, partial [Myxococcales bacterium]|nr:hypothetical protein [Myxococcales bacterium]